jgi:hypothetical protein
MVIGLSDRDERLRGVCVWNSDLCAGEGLRDAEAKGRRAGCGSSRSIVIGCVARLLWPRQGRGAPDDIAAWV